MRNDISVGLGEVKVSSNPEDILIAFGLGSCIGVGMYDPITRIGGMLHAVLPQSNGKQDSPAKYVDTGIALLLNQLQKAGAAQSRLIVRIAGGANMLTAPGMQTFFDIGTRNIEATHNILKKLGLKISCEEVGGQIGRTVRLYIVDGRMTIRTMGGQEKDM